MHRPLAFVLGSCAMAQEFAAPTNAFFAAAFPGSTVAADFDGDGDLDVLTHEALFARLAFHRNDGEGVFVPTGTTYPLLAAGYAVGVGNLVAVDVDGDGDQDVLVATMLTSPCGTPDVLLRNAGNGTFVVSAMTGLADNTRQLQPFDFDNDGDQDALQVNFHGGVFCGPLSSRLLRNNGVGSFTDVTGAVMPNAPSLVRSAAIFDLQGDGRRDVAFDNGALFLNNGTQFVPAPVALPVALDPVRAADLDGDGDDDLYGIAQGNVVVLRNVAGVLTSIAMPTLPQPARDVIAGQTDADGDFDLWITPLSGGAGRHRLWRHDPGMVFVDVTATQVPYLTWVSTVTLFLDSDGDGDQDVLVPSYGLLHNDGNGRFVDFGWPGTARNGRAADLDGDGRTDVVAFPSADGSPSIAWWRGREGGGFEFVGNLLPATSWQRAWLVPKDFDGDGDLDVFAATPTLAAERLLRNNGQGLFTDATATSLPPIPPGTTRVVQKPAAADFDGDGDVDLLLVRGPQFPTSTQDALYLNDGTGHFVDAGPTHFVDGGETQDAVALDFDRDGDVDLAILNATTGLRLFANDGTAHFTDVTATQVPSAPPGSLLAVDVDGDGDQDLVVSWSTAWVLRNNSGVFVASQLPAPVSGAQHPTAADFDDDGDSDLLLGGEWFRNDGTGTFTATGTPSMYLEELVDEHLLADVDDDGDPDLLGFLQNRHRQLDNALPPRLGLHGELHLRARSTAAGWPAGAFLFLGPPAPTPVPLGSLGSLGLDPALAWLHSTSLPPASGAAVVRYLCPAHPALLGSVLGAQALFLHGPTPAEWRFGNTIVTRVLL